METFYAIIFALDQATSHVKLVLEVNKAFSPGYKTVCVWKREMLGGFEVGQQVIITFKKNYLFNSFIRRDELMGYFITKLKLQVKIFVEKNGRGFFKLVDITKEPFDSCFKSYSSVAVGERQI